MTGIKKQLIAAGCPATKVDRCTKFVRQAITECVEHHKMNPDKPQGAEVVRRLGKLRKAFADLDSDREGKAARAILNTQPGWSRRSIDEIDQAIRAAEKVTRKKRGPHKGTRVAPAIDWFLRWLYVSATVGEFEWHAYKNRETGAAEGNLVQFLRSLERGKQLPKGFVPISDATLLKSISRSKGFLAPQ